MSPSEPRQPEHSRELERARASYAHGAWKDAYQSFSAIDRAAPAEESSALPIEDLERLALSAALTGHDDDFLQTLARIYERGVAAGDRWHAARSALWSFLRLQSIGEAGRASGWLTRLQRLCEDKADSIEHAYLLVPLAAKSLMTGDAAAAREAAGRAVAIGQRLGDADVVAMARNFEGRALIYQGKVSEGIALLDENMLAATTQRPSPLVTVLVYCMVISTCNQVHAFERAREWTTVLSDWCAARPDLVQFRGTCMVHRAEIMQFGGDWSQAIEQARLAAAGVAGVRHPDALGEAHYQIGEIQRLRGELGAAEEAYKSASHLGCEPQPGLALVRLAQGQGDAAAGGIRRALAETRAPLARARLLPAAIEILIRIDALEEARETCRELEGIADFFGTEALHALAAHARAVIHLYDDDAQAALGPLRRAFWTWQKIGAPYAAARVRLDLARACAALGDHEGERLELEAARRTFADLGAALDLAALAPPAPAAVTAGAHGLTQRELQVLRLVASGKTNKSIAKELCLSEKTIDRHVSNIFTKIDVSSRAAATAFAYEHGLI